MSTTPNTITSFFRYNIVAIIATSIDFLVFILLTEALQLWYLFSAIVGAVLGGITAFVLERNWTFMKSDGKLSCQSVKYFMVWLASIFLNITGLYIMVEYAACRYIFSKVVVAIVVGIGFNFLTHKYFVFK